MLTNYIAIIVAAIVGFGIGWAWYSNMLFGKMWRREMGVSGDGTSMKGMGKTMTLGFLSTLVMAFVLENLIIVTGAFVTTSASLVLAVWLWLGFVATILVGGVLWEKKSWKFFAINASYYLVMMLVMAAILGNWK